ncbi:hypothetical protein CA234_09600 [Sphingomonas sp. ABOLE]|nr:hypothetical protein CA234_09600 [Sphingomonas sp. ABOLE]
MLLKTIGDSLDDIRREDGATDQDLGVVLGRSKDSAERYRKGEGEMGVLAFLLGCKAWDGRFANPVFNLLGFKLVEMQSGAGSDRAGFTALATLLAELAEALEDDNIVDDRELAAMASAVESAGKHIDRLRERLSLRLVSNRG